MARSHAVRVVRSPCTAWSKVGCCFCCRVRTSSGTFLNRDHDDVVRRIEERIARFSKIPFGNGESLQILHYGKPCQLLSNTVVSGNMPTTAHLVSATHTL